MLTYKDLRTSPSQRDGLVCRHHTLVLFCWGHERLCWLQKNSSTLSFDCAAVCCRTMRCIPTHGEKCLRVDSPMSLRLFATLLIPCSLHPIILQTQTLLPHWLLPCCFSLVPPLFNCSLVCSSGKYFMTLHISACVRCSSETVLSPWHLVASYVVPASGSVPSMVHGATATEISGSGETKAYTRFSCLYICILKCFLIDSITILKTN